MRKHTTALALLVAGTVAVTLTACGGNPTTHAVGPTASAPVRLPASFPAKKVPILPGTLLTAAGDPSQGWSVTVSPKQGDVKAAESELEGAGFKATRVDDGSATLEDPEFTVAVHSPGKSITYIVTEK